MYYRVRKNWEDKDSQIGAFTVLQNALLQAALNPGYKVFDGDGNQVYPEETQDALDCELQREAREGGSG